MTSVALAVCNDPARPSVDWSGCIKARANLTSAHLYLAGLTNANLQRAWLTYANLYHANLRNADLSGATWIDGRESAYGSIGGCYHE